MPFKSYWRDAATVLIILVAAGAYFLCDMLTPSPKEKLKQIIDKMAQAAARADTQALLADLTEDYSQDDMDRAGLESSADKYFQTYGATQVTVRKLDLNVQGQIAVADVRIFTKAANLSEWGADGAESIWRLSFIRNEGHWGIERIMPVLVMGQSVSGFNFKEELRNAAEQALKKADLRLAVQKAQQRLANEAQRKLLKQKRDDFVGRYPPASRNWVLDDFEDGPHQWFTEDWAHPTELAVEEYRDSRRLKAMVTRGEKDKAAIERDIQLDFRSRDLICVDVDNLSGAEFALALALQVQERNGEFEWYESAMQRVRKGANDRLCFDLHANDFKCLRTGWRHMAEVRDLDGVIKLFFLIYTVREGTVYFDNIVAIRQSDKPLPPELATDHTGRKGPRRKRAPRSGGAKGRKLKAKHEARSTKSE